MTLALFDNFVFIQFCSNSILYSVVDQHPFFLTYPKFTEVFHEKQHRLEIIF